MNGSGRDSFWILISTCSVIFLNMPSFKKFFIWDCANPFDSIAFIFTFLDEDFVISLMKCGRFSKVDLR